MYPDAPDVQSWLTPLAHRLGRQLSVTMRPDGPGRVHVEITIPCREAEVAAINDAIVQHDRPAFVGVVYCRWRLLSSSRVVPPPPPAALAALPPPPPPRATSMPPTTPSDRRTPAPDRADLLVSLLAGPYHQLDTTRLLHAALRDRELPRDDTMVWEAIDRWDREVGTAYIAGQAVDAWGLVPEGRPTVGPSRRAHRERRACAVCGRMLERRRSAFRGRQAVCVGRCRGVWASRASHAAQAH